MSKGCVGSKLPIKRFSHSQISPYDGLLECRADPATHLRRDPTLLRSMLGIFVQGERLYELFGNKRGILVVIDHFSFFKIKKSSIFILFSATNKLFYFQTFLSSMVLDFTYAHFCENRLVRRHKSENKTSAIVDSVT